MKDRIIKLLKSDKAFLALVIIIIVICFYVPSCKKQQRQEENQHSLQAE